MTDDERFEEFVRRFQNLVFGTAVRLLADRAEAEDVSQTVFLKAFERFQVIEMSPSAAGWLKTVTRNACLNHLSRVRSRWRSFSELGRDDAGAGAHRIENAIDTRESPAARLERADEDARLEHALRALPDHQRVPLVLFHFEDMSYQQIAAALDISLGKVKTDIHRGREALRTVLTSHEPH